MNAKFPWSSLNCVFGDIFILLSCGICSPLFDDVWCCSFCSSLSSPLWRSLIQCLSHKFIRVFLPLCTSAHFQHSQLQSVIRRYDIPASLISTQHWCFFWTFSWDGERHCREWQRGDNIWQIDEVKVSNPNFSLLSVFSEQTVLGFLLKCSFIEKWICIYLAKWKDTLNLSSLSEEHNKYNHFIWKYFQQYLIDREIERNYKF